jgi:hypothetical protein
MCCEEPSFVGCFLYGKARTQVLGRLALLFWAGTFCGRCFCQAHEHYHCWCPVVVIYILALLFWMWILTVLLNKYFHVAEPSVLIFIIVCKNIYKPEKRRSWICWTSVKWI